MRGLGDPLNSSFFHWLSPYPDSPRVPFPLLLTAVILLQASHGQLSIRRSAGLVARPLTPAQQAGLDLLPFFPINCKSLTSPS